MNINEVIVAKVISVEPYGIWLEYKKSRGLLKIIDLTWEERLVNPAEFAKINDQLKVVVIKILNLKDCQFIASLKDICPEKNPWRNPLIFMQGARFRGVVTNVTDYGYFVRHPVGIKGLILKEKESKSLKIGDEIDVEVEVCDLDLKKILLKLN